jgi:hypothetical protein
MIVEALVILALGLVALWLCGCSTLDTAETYASGPGTVYVCDTEQGCPGGLDEYCWNGSRAELQRLLGATCHAEEVTERAWPALVGCAYCCGPDCGAGANAHCGAVCR